MRKGRTVVVALLLSAVMASASDVEQYETFLGFSFVRFKPHSGLLPSFNSHGGDGQFVYNLNSYIGAVVDVGAVTKGELNHRSVDSTVVTFVAGPRFKYHGESRFQPFVEMLFGGAYSTASTPLSLPSSAAADLPASMLVNPNSVSARLVLSRTGFAMFAGGGLDIKVNKHIAFRPIGADYYSTRLPGPLTGNPQNVGNFRYSAGINFLFGAQ